MIIDPKDVTQAKFHSYMLGTIAPRPIAFASTIDVQGNINLSPFSFFNCFGSRPPILVFSPSRRGRDNTIKHTLENVKAVPEVVINIVNYDMVQQMSLASTEYPRGVDEFVKSGLTPVASTRVKPPRVKESPAAFECVVKQVIETGTEGGAGNMVVCEILLAHIKDEILDEDSRVDPRKLDAVARMGGNWYCRANGEALFTVPKPLDKLGIGVDAIPEQIRTSRYLTGNDLGLLGNVEALPTDEEVSEFKNQNEDELAGANMESVHKRAHELIESGDVMDAWKILLAYS